MDWFASLDRRERLFVIAAAVVVALAIVWFGLWRPLATGHSAAELRVAEWRSSLAALRPLRGQLASGNRPASANRNQSLVVVVDSSLRQRGLYSSLQRSQPTPGGAGIRVELEAAAFDDLMLWLGDLHSQFALQVQSGSFSVASDAGRGRVNASVTLQR